MKVKFNYLTYLLVFVVLLLFLEVLYMIVTSASTIFNNNKNKLAVTIGILTTLLGMIYGITVFIDLLLKYRYKITLHKSSLFISDMLLLRNKDVQLDKIKTAEEDGYVYNTFLKAIVITLKTGEEYKMINLFIINYKSTKNVLKRIKQSIKNKNDIAP